MEGIYNNQRKSSNDKIINQAKTKRGGLMVVLNETQRKVGYLPKEVQTYIAKQMNVPPALSMVWCPFIHFSH
jgi:NADH-quinone oxidoreductase subunit E/NADP-reducing hydrogenase subunit HndA